MCSYRLHSLLLPPCTNFHNPTSQVSEPKINSSSLHCSYPGVKTFSDALLSIRKCTENEDPKMGSCFHGQILKSGLESDVFVANSLLNMYSKCDQIKDAENVFDHMPYRTIVSWTSMMSGYYRNGLADEAILLFSAMLEYLQPNEFSLAVVLQACALKGDEKLVQVIHCFAVRSGLMLDKFLQNSLIDAYAKLGMLTAAEKLLERLYRRDEVSWTCVISGSVSHGNSKRALAFFCGMQEDGVIPNDVTMLAVLKACSELNNYQIMKWIHGLVLKGNWCMNSLVLNSLIEMYSTNGYFIDSLTIFFRFCFNNKGLYPSPETMANIVQDSGNFEQLNVGKEIHGYLIKHRFLPCTTVENSLMNMYARNGQEDSALLLFRMMPTRDIISWNTIISSLVKNDQPVGALRFLSEIHREGSQDNVSPDFVTLLTSLEACSDLALLLQGQILHGYLIRTGLLGDIFIQNALIDVYAKSGRLDFAENIFKEMHERDIGSWNSIIAAYGINGNGTSALNIFSDLEGSGTTKPNEITFLNVLSACSHTGLVEQGLEIFKLMETRYGIQPRMEHYACMVDLLGRAGRVEEAETFIHKMPIRPGPDVWGALLSASVLIGNTTIAEKAAKELAVLEPNSSIWRVALSNAYAAAGKWREVAEIRAELRGSKKLKKEGGWSSINVEGCEFSFMAGETKCLESATIYEIIGSLQSHMRDEVQLAVELC
ncbi:hypothetical protein CDL12_09375 [Handroanthus impetiginosus]|uniref:Pentacotripeptide-repeat region of PRORP domain-containing protein n=1 Tax=Handroanthus impetiginosus TaxID=429701 RepID=A0A2G9HKA6_9LAMI|nr:hypothetical protein CDL12_09375 [Handroanthus impetiginosus]